VRKYLLAVALTVLVGGCAAQRSETTTAASSSATVTTRATTTSTSTTTTTAPPRVFTRANYTELVTEPDSFKGSTVDVVGRIFGEVSRQDGRMGFQMFGIPEESEGNTVVFYAGEAPISGDDYVRVVGTVTGEYEGTNAFGGTVASIQVIATKVEQVDALAAAAPARREVKLGVTQTQHGLSVTVKAVQYAERETRVLLRVVNGSATEASFYRSSAKAVQGTKQFDSTYAGDYPEVQSSILPGVTSEGVVVFPAMGPNAATRLIFEGRTDDYRLDFNQYVFNVPAS
jgi:hypothetical protein